MRLHPFTAVRPTSELAARVAAVPYDVVSRSEAVELARGNPYSFLHVGRSDIDLPDGTDPHDPLIYTTARETLDRLIREGTLLRDREPSLYLYRQIREGRAQTGIVACVHVDDYESDVIRKHEKTRPDKEDDRTRHVLTLNAHAEPVFLAYRGRSDIDELMAAMMGTPAVYDFVAPDDVRHTVWKISHPAAIVEAFRPVPHTYVADGHHRSASAWRAGRERRAANPNHTGNEEYNWFLAVLFPADQLTILPYYRLLRNLGGQTAETVLERLREVGRLCRVKVPQPVRPGRFGVYLGRTWYEIVIEEQSIDRKDPIGSLDVSLLQDRILGPVLGVGDPRTDKRLEFVGGSRGTAELERRVDSGEMAIAFSLYPTTMDQLMAVADAGTVMPPKSTWFEPKLRSGLFVHQLD